MEIDPYLNSSVLPVVHTGNKTNDKRTLGHLIEKNNQKLKVTGLKNFDIAIVGAPFEPKTRNKGTGNAPSVIRKILYSLSIPNSKLKLIDLGDILEGGNVNSTFYAIRDMVDYLTEAGLTVIVLGGGQEISVGISRAFSNKPDYSLSTIDPWPDMDSIMNLSDNYNYVSKIIREKPDIFSLNFIGSQSYYVPPQQISHIREMGHSLLRLGNLRPDISVVEPILRDTDFLSFDLSSIKYSDSPGNLHPNPNGLTGEEACQISRFAGLSDRLRVFGLFEANPGCDTSNITAKLTSQMIWYFIEGFLNRKNETPGRKDPRYIEYMVHFDELNAPLVFYQNIETERWWMQLINNENDQVMIPCHQSDYKTALTGEIPDLWWQMIRKYDRLPK